MRLKNIPFDCVDISTEDDSFYCYPKKENAVTKLAFAAGIIFQKQNDEALKNRMKARGEKMNRLLIICLALTLMFSCFAACDTEVTHESSIIEVSVESPDSSSPEVFAESGEIAESSIAVESIVPEDSVISFLALPDNLVHCSMYYDAIENAAESKGVAPNYSDLHNADYDFLPFYTHIAEQIEKADIAYINQESLIGGDSRKISAYPCFNTPVGMAEAVAELGFDVVNVAHNHMLDSGNTDYLEFCSNFFEERNIEALGYYPTKESAEDIIIIEREGIKVAFLTYTYGTNGIENNSDSEFVIPYFEEELIEKQIAVAKEKADVIIVSAHWGYEYSYEPNSMQKEYAQYFCDLGVDVIVGMHSHCIQPMEWLESENGHKTLVTYSLGTIVSGIRKGMSALAGMLALDIRKDGETGEITIESPMFIPTVAHYIRGRSVADDDTGSREYTIYPLTEYTQELAEAHSLCRAERIDGKTTLVGGAFSRETLIATVKEYIDEEFLPELE